MGIIQSAHYAETEKWLKDDEIVQRMAAELRIGGCPRKKVAHDHGEPRHGFMGAADTAYRRFGGTDGGHPGAIGAAIIALAYDTPTTRYTLRTTCEQLSSKYVFDAVTRVELLMLLHNLVQDVFGATYEQIEVRLYDRHAIMRRTADDQVVAELTIDEGE